MDHIYCSIFPEAGVAVPQKELHFSEIIEDIKSEKYAILVTEIRDNIKNKEVKDKLKKKLYGFTPSATFSPRRAINNVQGYNGMVVIDLDEVHTLNKAKYLKLLLSQDPYVTFAFVSPSFGVKVFIQTGNKDPKKHYLAFKTCFERIALYQKFTTFKIDPSGKDVSRLCFVSYDPEIYFNKSAEILAIDHSLELELSDFRSVGIVAVQVGSTDSKKLYKRALAMIKKSKVGGFVAGNRNNYVYCLACLCNEFAIPEETAIDYICQNYPSLGYKETKDTIHSAYKHHNGKFGSKNDYSNNQNSLF